MKRSRSKHAGTDWCFWDLPRAWARSGRLACGGAPTNVVVDRDSSSRDFVIEGVGRTMAWLARDGLR